MNENHPAKPQKYNSLRFCGATAVNPGEGRQRQDRTIDPVAKNDFRPVAAGGSCRLIHPGVGQDPGFAGLRMGAAFAMGHAMIGSPWVGGALALVEPACNTAAFDFHE